LIGQIEELGRLISNVSSVVPEGIVVFFPSFEYESQVHATWTEKGILTSIQMKKHVYREPRSASEVEDVLQKYRESITKASDQMDKATHNRRGALLLCVVGGKMSEGINFSDGMGRCVVMVGLPYPSPSDPELIERMRYIDQLPAAEVGAGNSGTAVNGNHVLQRCGQRGREYYDNLCMKAVNQSIGKPIFPTHLHCIETLASVVC
jgi:chromosome transmission fidelity protein 1